MLTGERRFLDRWIDYIDDWAMFEIADTSVRPTDLTDSTNSFNGQIPLLFQTIGGIARTLPLKQNDFPADTLARILGKLIRVYPTAALIYFDSNPQNWTPHAMATMMKTTMLMDEFKAAEYIFNRARHRQENYGTTEGLPDGSEAEHALWYNRHLYTSCEEALELAAERRSVPVYKRPFWEGVLSTPAWEDQERRTMTDRARYLLQMITPQSQNPIGNRNDQRSVSGVKTGEEFALFEVAPDLRVLTETLRGNIAGGLPDFTMSAFPYSGSWIMRTGWGKDAGYGHFFCSPYPTGGHALPGMKGNNGLCISHAGQDLLVAGGFGNYSYDRSPIRVDGKEQFANAGIGHGSTQKGHKGFGVVYIDPLPADWRSHSSLQFDFAEGVYDGPYGDFVNDHHDNGAFSAEFLAERARSVIAGIRHQRQIFFVKEHGVWIVVDRLQSSSPRQYSLDWRLPTPPVRQFEGKPAPNYKGKSFAVESVQINPSHQNIVTAAADMPNLQIRHFGPAMEFSTEREDGEAVKDDYTLRYKLYDFWRISGTWKSTGNDLIVSLIEVIPAGAAPQIGEIETLGDGKNTRGFKATINNGKNIAFLASANGDAELKAAGIPATADVLLICGNHGISLGCNKFQDKETASGDFEFNIEKDSTTSMTTIWSPIAPVKIEPRRNVISGDEPITLSCATEGVEIHYTLDGREPDLQSILYTGPITVNGSVMIKARAFRPGLARVPTTPAGTKATVTAVANYIRQEALAPVAALGDNRYTSGLNAEYYEGDWKDLVFFPESAKPQKKQNVRNLFERCSPNVEKVFGWTYSGFLAIPADGVYTFHAPLEMVTSPQEPGYALRLFVGQEKLSNGKASGNLNEWYPATTRHAYGTWSIALKKGLQPFKLIYVDYRTDAVERFNHPGMLLNTIWSGATPDLRVSGPGIDRQPIPKDWFTMLLKTENKK